MRPNLFNFRHAMDRAGIPMTTQNNWAVGHILRKWASDHGVQPDRVLADKTSDSPSVKAPHVLAHYPIDMLPDAAQYLRSIWEDRRDANGRLQGQFDFG